MKLLFCANCRDVLKLQSPKAKRRTCACGACSGWYLTDDPAEPRAVVKGDYVQVIALSNDSLFPTIYRVATERPRNLGCDRYTAKDDYCLAANQIDAWVYGPNALEVTRNTTMKTPRTESPRHLTNKRGGQK